MNQEWYSGKDGADYLMQRKTSQAESVQKLRATLFQDVGGATLKIVDFGCGTGGILGSLPASERVGVEIGAEAAKIAEERGLSVVPSLKRLDDGQFDVAISFHAIEHVDSPLEVLQELKRIVKPGGRVRLVVPAELPFNAVHRSWRENYDRHLFTWTPLTFGNLAYRAGFRTFSVSIRPMPTNSRVVRYLRFVPLISRSYHWLISLRKNNFNVVFDAIA